MNKTILLVDDDQRLRELLKDYLKEKNLIKVIYLLRCLLKEKDN